MQYRHERRDSFDDDDDDDESQKTTSVGSYKSGTYSSNDADDVDRDSVKRKVDHVHAAAFDDDSTAYSPLPDSYGRHSNISIASYASTAASIPDDVPDRVLEDADFEMPEFLPNEFYTDTIPTTPSDFGKLFPSTRKLTISHDDSVHDGNVNLKINTQVRLSKGRTQNMTLFHLRMYDLKRREFSIRRHDRNSGREVAHTVRKYQKTTEHSRPILQRSFSSAVAGLRSLSDSKAPTAPRVDSRNGSRKSFDTDGSSTHSTRAQADVKAHPRIPTNTTRLEFANYAHVEVKRRGTKSKKRYDFEYWGATYSWRRTVTNQDGRHAQASFQLVRSGEGAALANIVPEPLSPAQLSEELEKGCWVPPCAMWISDDRLLDRQRDISDVVVVSGLVALVDDCIKRRFHDKAAPVERSLLSRFARKHSLPLNQDGDQHLKASTAHQSHTPRHIPPALRHAVTT